MKISFTTVGLNLGLQNGYGIAGYGMVTSLGRLGHSVPFQDPSADVEIGFCQPILTPWSSDSSYKIQYTPWESTELPAGWKDAFNSVDEVWTPSSVVADWYKAEGVTAPVKVYEHGIGKEWRSLSAKPFKEGKFTFLHHGSPAPRKNAQGVVNSFIKLYEEFGDDIHLVLKAAGSTEARILDRGGNIVGDIWDHPGISIINNMMEEEGLIELYNSVDAMVYPTWGEGFGIIPLQALASGLPVVTTEGCAPYRDFLSPSLRLTATLEKSPWQHPHKGKMWKVPQEEIERGMREVLANYDTHRSKALALEPMVKRIYDWDRLTSSAFEDVIKRFG